MKNFLKTLFGGIFRRSLSLTFAYDDSLKAYSVSGYCGKGSKAIIPDTYDDGINGKHSVTKIDDHAFRHCVSLKSVTVPDSVTVIGWNAFSSCTALTDIVLSDNVSDIDSGAFEYTLWYSAQPDGAVYLGKVLLGYKGTMPDNAEIIVKNGTKCIADRAFLNRSSLTDITLPGSVTSIGSSAFENCSSLKNLVLPDGVSRIDDKTFSDCSSLTSITIP
ncbi:MAG: leucine-rich repeat domain-containing protein, partial [Christensenellales bacterium]